VAAACTAIDGGEVPRSSPHDPPFFTFHGVPLDRILSTEITIRPIPVLTPLPDISMHIVQAPSIWLVLAYLAWAFEINPFVIRPIGNTPVAIPLLPVEHVPEVKG